MAFKRIVTITCDGPCGTALQTEKVPTGWVKWLGSTYERLATGQKPTKTPLSIYLCPSCADAFVRHIEPQFAIQRGGQHER